MSKDLYKKLCDPQVLKIAANYAYEDKKDDFIPDTFRNQDYYFNLKENLERLAQALKHGTYRPRPLKEMDIPKSGLAVRPGSSLDIEDHIVLYAIAFLLAPLMDRVLPSSVFHFRVKKLGKRPHPEKLFENEGPILVRREIRRKLRIFGDWYEAWPDFVAEAQGIYEKDGFTFMVESDISAYFENISHPLLADILRKYAPSQLHLINLLMEMLAIWATPSLSGYRPQRGIPQGNEVSSWLGTLYLVDMDAELLKLQRKGLIKYVRYVDDIKVFTKDHKTARSVIFMINRILRCLHLNMQSAKTEIFEDGEIRKRLYDERVEQVSDILKCLPEDPKKITAEQKIMALEKVRPIYRKHLAYRREMEKKDFRLFKRVLTVLSRIGSNMAVQQSLKWIWKQPVLTEKVCRYLPRWIHYKSVRIALENALFGDEELFYAQYLYLLPMFRNSPALNSSHKAQLMHLGCNRSFHPAVRAEALLCLAPFPLDVPDYKRLLRCYFGESLPPVKKTILSLFLKAPDRIKKDMFSATIQEPDEETNRFRKYLWALANNVILSQKTLAVLRRVEKDPARMLISLYGALQSTNPETFKCVERIAKERCNSATSQIVSHAFERVSADAVAMFNHLVKPAHV